MTTESMALLLAEGETAKAKSLKDWLDTEHKSGSTDARVILWRTYFAHMAAAGRYLELAKVTPGVDVPRAPLPSRAECGSNGSLDCQSTTPSHRCIGCPYGVAAVDPTPAAWLRKDGMKAMPADEKEAWIEAGQPEIAEDYTIPLYRNAGVALPLEGRDG